MYQLILTTLIGFAIAAGYCDRLSGEESQFKYPVDVVSAADGALYVADLRLPGIWKIVDGKAEVFVQGEARFRTPLNAIRCLALDKQGQLLAGDSATREVYRVSSNGELKPLTGGQIGIPMCMVAFDDGIYVSDIELQRIWKVPTEGGEPEEFAVIAAVRGIATAEDGSLRISTGLKPNVAKVTADGVITPILDEGKFSFTNQLAVGKDGVIYVADGYAKTIWKISEEGTAEPWVVGEPFVNPVGLAWRDDDLLVVDPRANRVFAVSSTGAVTCVYPAE